jgi:hypothetical protein
MKCQQVEYEDGIKDSKNDEGIILALGNGLFPERW